MSIFRNDTLGSWTRGGQAIVHNVRMTLQVFFQSLLAGMALWLIGTVWYTLEHTTEYQRFVLARIVEAKAKSSVTPGVVQPVLFRTPSGRQYWTSADAILKSGTAKNTVREFEKDAFEGALIAGVFTLMILVVVWWSFTRTGKGLGSNEFLRGAHFGTRRDVKRLLRGQKKGSFAIGGVDVPSAFETEHILLCGAPGTGKTNIIVKMLDGIRTEGRRAIVYDTAGTFVQKFYRPGYDILLNPFDERTSVWSPWVDVPKESHYDQIAAATVPDKSGDPFWVTSARGTLVAVMRKLKDQQRMLVSAMLDVITRSGLKKLSAFLEDTAGAAFVSVEGERTSAGIQAELASVLRGFSYLDDTEDGFSIRDWVANEVDDSWLFVTVQADQLSSLRPLITVWLDIAVSAIMSLAPDDERRIYCVLDELPTLQKLHSLSDFLARSRKYGGCGILGFQSYPQLEATYGIQDAAAITGYCSTWVALRANDTPTAKLISENLGQAEQVEANEGMSYGVNDMRDGVNLSRMQVTRPLVMHTEVTNLANLCGFLRFGRNLPVVRFKDRFNRVPETQPAFVERLSPPRRIASGPLVRPSAEGEEMAATPPPGAVNGRNMDVPRPAKRKPDKHASPELPLAAGDEPGEESAPAQGGDSDASGARRNEAGGDPAVEPLGRRNGFGLRKHDRNGGLSKPAKPA